MTKFRLYIMAMKEIFWIGAIGSMIVPLIFIFSNSIVHHSILVIIFFTLLLFSFIVIPVSIIPIRGLLYICKQEKELGFSFAEEMKFYDVCGANFVNRQWFIDIDKTHIVVFRRDYIKSIGEIDSFYGKNNECMVRMISTKDTEFIIKSSFESLERLKEWFIS